MRWIVSGCGILYTDNDLFFLSEPTGGEVKTIFLCLPSEMKNEVPYILKQRWDSDDAMNKAVKRRGGGDLYCDVDSVTGVIDVVQTFDDLVDGSTYYLFNDYYSAVRSSKTRGQVEDRVLEEQVSSAMVNDIGEGAHVHRNVKFVDPITKKDIAEIDRTVIHKGGEDVSNSVAYIVECALSPQKKDVKRLVDTVGIFNQHAPSSPHFRSVVEVVPVLGGKLWSEEVIQECRKTNETRVLGGLRPILRIQPSGKDFKVIREFSSFARTLLKHL